jgi:serine/threonine-protein kinase
VTAILDTDDQSEELPICLTSEPVAAGSPGHYGVGSVLAEKYRLDSLLGMGAMGAVWQATNLQLDAQVAIKLAHTELTSGAFRKRLQREARAAASLTHPGIVRVFDVGETDAGDPFIVMELLQGATLAEMTSQGPLAAERAVQIVLPIVDALVATHERGIVHRDLKPDNLLVALEDQRVQPKILDFGIAISNDSRDGRFAIDDGGVLVGSPEYMSPEQAIASDDIDYATDIWSICVVLYEAIAGDTPFNSPHAALLLRAIIEGEPVSLADRGVADEQLWKIVRRGLSKARRERHASMSALGRQLARWLLDSGVQHDVCGTSLESKWFGEDAVAARTMSALQPTPDLRHTLASVRTTPPRRARASNESPLRRRATAQTRSVGAVKVCTLLGALGLTFSALMPKGAASALAMVSKAESAVERRAADVLANQSLPALVTMRSERVSPRTGLEPTLADVPSSRAKSSPKPAASHGVANGAQRGQHVQQTVPVGKAWAAAIRVERDLIAPY